MSALKRLPPAGTNTSSGRTNTANDNGPSTCWIRAAKGIQKCFKKGICMYLTKDLWKALNTSSNNYCMPNRENVPEQEVSDTLLRILTENEQWGLIKKKKPET